MLKALLAGALVLAAVGASAHRPSPTLDQVSDIAAGRTTLRRAYDGEVPRPGVPVVAGAYRADLATDLPEIRAAARFPEEIPAGVQPTNAPGMWDKAKSFVTEPKYVIPAVGAVIGGWGGWMIAAAGTIMSPWLGLLLGAAIVGFIGYKIAEMSGAFKKK